MSRVNFSGKHQNLEDVISFFNLNRRNLMELKREIKNGTNKQSDYEKFIGFTSSELDLYFEEKLEELEKTGILNLIAATEAHLRIDFYQRVYKRKKDNLSKAFRNIYLTKGNKISLEEHILEEWKINNESYKKSIGDFKGVLKYRHWLAHGRYWVFKFKSYGDISDIYIICDNIINIMNIKEN